jgi:hypothetical protein
MQLDVFTLILALNVVLKTNVILSIVFLLLDAYNDVACFVDDPLLLIVIPIYGVMVVKSLVMMLVRLMLVIRILDTLNGL